METPIKNFRTGLYSTVQSIAVLQNNLVENLQAIGCREQDLMYLASEVDAAAEALKRLQSAIAFRLEGSVLKEKNKENK